MWELHVSHTKRWFPVPVMWCLWFLELLYLCPGGGRERRCIKAIVNGAGLTFFFHFCVYLYFWLPWVFIAGQELPLVALSGSCSLVVLLRPRAAQASHCGGFSCRARAQWHTGFSRWHSGSISWALEVHELSCPRGRWDLPGTNTGIKPVSPVLAVKFLTPEPPRKFCGWFCF